MRKAKIDGDAAQFLLWQAVRVIAGKRFYQRALAVVNVTGSGEDGVAGGHRFKGNRSNLNVAFTGTSFPFTSRCGPKK